MSASRRTPKGRRRERGAVLAVTGIAMIMIVGMAVIGVDVGRLAFTANETQSLADVAATAYIKTMADNLEGGTSDDPVAHTRVAVEANFVDSKQASLDDNIASLVEGVYDFDSGTFAPGVQPANAVEATGVVTVNNFFAAIFGDPQSTVTRVSRAAFGPPNSADNLLPIAVEACNYPEVLEGDCADLPTFDRIPADPDDGGGEDSCWTSFGTSPASRNTVLSYFPDGSCQLVGSASVGDQISLIKGEIGGLAKKELPDALQDCANVDPPITKFTVPMVPCGKCNDVQEIVGFAEIEITAIGSPPGREIQAATICKKDESGAGGPGSGPFGGIITHALVR